MSILTAETELLIQEQAAKTGRTPDQVVREAIALARLSAMGATTNPAQTLPKDELLRRMRDIADRAAALPVLDPRSPDEIIGYDEFGVPS